MKEIRCNEGRKITIEKNYWNDNLVIIKIKNHGVYGDYDDTLVLDRENVREMVKVLLDETIKG